MLRNFITDTELLAYYPQLEKYIPNSQNDFAPQINEAFELLLADLYNNGIDTKLLGIPLDLLRPVDSTTPQNALTKETVSFAQLPRTFDYGIRLKGYTRFCVDVSLIVDGTYTVSLFGSNDLNVSTNVPPQNWIKILDLDVAQVGIFSKKFTSEYSYYRMIVNSNDANFSIILSLFLLETWADKLIIYKTLSLIGMANRKEQGDYSDLMYINYTALYDSLFAGVKMYIDMNKNNLPESSEITTLTLSEFFR